MSKAERIMGAYNASGEVRSEEYREGVFAALFNLEHLDSVAVTPQRCPYPNGSASRDAWLSGLNEGKRLWRVNVWS